MTPNSNEKPKWWEPVWELSMHMLLGSLLFAIMFTPAVLLDLSIQWLKEFVSEFLSRWLEWTKVGLAIIDTSLYFIFLLRKAWIFVNKLWRPEYHEQ